MKFSPLKSLLFDQFDCNNYRLVLQRKIFSDGSIPNCMNSNADTDPCKVD